MCERHRAIGHLVYEQANMRADAHRWTDAHAGRKKMYGHTQPHPKVDIHPHGDAHKTTF